MKFACHSCRGHIEAGDEYAGQEVACPHCGSPLLVPWAVAPPAVPIEPAGDSKGLIEKRKSYPKWPWICFAVFCFLWLCSIGWLSTIDKEAQPLLNEYRRMSSTEYQLQVGLEAFFRGAMGDPFGKASEESYKANAITRRLSELYTEYENARTNRNLFGMLTLISAVLWFWNHNQYAKEQNTDRQQPALH